MPLRYLLVSLVVLSLGAIVAAVQPVANPAGTPELFAPLKKGMMVGFREVNGAYQITVSNTIVPAHRIAEIGTDYLAIRELKGLQEFRIPITSIRVIQVQRP